MSRARGAKSGTPLSRYSVNKALPCSHCLLPYFTSYFALASLFLSHLALLKTTVSSQFKKTVKRRPPCRQLSLGYQCLPGMFICKSGFCIRAASVCNGIRECSDGSDELNCGIRNKCPLGKFACSNGRCVSASDVCDGYNDCGDRSDETNCRITTTARPACSLREFTCWNGRCINFNWVCDGYEDCTDGSDELRCGAHLKAGGVIGIIVACSVLITVVIIAVVCLRNWKQDKRTGTVFSVQPLSAGIPLQPLPQRLQPTPNPQPATTPSAVTQQQGNFHSEVGHGIPQTEVQQRSNLYPSLPQQMCPVIPQNSAS